VKKEMRSFWKEEKGQGAIEYILLAGGVVVAAVVIFTIYSKMTAAGANKLNTTGDAASSTMSSRISAEVAKMT
jgi:Flp pilus assembly pilin Flp